MHDAAAGTHPLHFAGVQHRAVAHRVGMGQGPLHHHRDDFHVAVGVHAEPLACSNGVVVDHPQGAEAHPVRILMAAEAEAVPGIEPVQLAVEALVCGSQDHG